MTFFDSQNYQLKARIAPSILSSMPILLFQYFFLSQEIENFFQFLGSMKVIGDISISLIILYSLSEINRFIAKAIFEKEEVYLPTTDFLLFSNSEYTKEYKNNIYDKIFKDFKIRLPREEQETNETHVRKRIAEAMSIVRKRVGPGKLLLHHNIQYGFFRNLIGGSIFGIIFSGVDIYFALVQNRTDILTISIIFIIAYLLLIILNNYIINKLGKWYARVLIQEYMEK